ncbi:MAG TPA: glycosyltransferase family 4 protein [Gaiellaceae bacterium]|nr:glycosyltransferase family 4 protein [Gaiellaceae bacterium]
MSTPASRRRRIVLLAHDVHDRGGMERAFAELVRRGSGEVEFAVVARTLAEDLRPLVDWTRVRVPARPAPLRFALYWLLAGRSLRRLRRGGDVVHALGAIVPDRVDVASVHHCHRGSLDVMGLTPAGAPVLRRLNTAVARILALAAERWCYRPSRVRVLAAVSEGTRAEVERFYPGVPSVLTPNGVDTSRFRPDPARRAELRRDLGVPGESVVALFVGGNWDLKGLRVAIEATALAGRRVPGLELWVLGRGDAARFGRVAAAAGAAEAVRFLGEVDEPSSFYASADVFVLPSLYETFSLVAYEAAASGLPVLATSVNGVREIVGADDGGRLLERTPAAFAEALEHFAEDRDARARAGDRARERAAAFTWERGVGAVLDVYRSLGEQIDAAAGAVAA